MPNATPAGFSPPPVSGSAEDPQLFVQAEKVSSIKTFPKDAPDLGRGQSVSGLVEANHSTEQLNTGDEKTSGDDQRGPCGQSRNRDEVIKEISISSTAFIGPAYRPQPAFEDELSEFYKELEQVEQPDTADGNNDGVSQPWPPPDTVDRNSLNVSRSWAPSHAVDGKSQHVSQSWAPPRAVDGKSQHVSQSWAPPHSVDGKGQHVSQSWTPPHSVDGKRQHVSQSWAPPHSVDGKRQHVSQSWAPPHAVDWKIQHVSQSWAPPRSVYGKCQHVSQSWAPPHSVDGKSQHVSQSWAPPHAVDGKSQHVSQSWAPPHTVDGKSQHVSHSWAPPHSVDGKSQHVSQSWAPPHSVDGKSQHVSQSYSPPDAVDAKSQHKAQSWPPLNNPLSLKDKVNDHRNTYRPYPETRQQPDYRNSPQRRPQLYDTTCAWSNPPSFQNRWPRPPTNIHFYPPPPPGYPPLHPPNSQPHGHQCSQPENRWLGPAIRPASSHSPALYNPNEAFERRRYEEQNYQDVNQEMRHDEPSFVLILMRGVPGSGKSTLARQISSRGPSGQILSTDDYFYQEDGYHFNPTLLGNAHDWNHNRAKKAMLEGRTPVIIDNTNAQAWEMKPYVSVALEMGYRVEFVEPDNSWKCDPVELERRNHHGVSRDTIAKMLDRFELPISVDVVMNSSEPSQKRKEHHSRPYRSR